MALTGREKQSATMKLRWQDPECRARMLDGRKNMKWSRARRLKHSQTLLALFQDPEWKAVWLANVRKGLAARPTYERTPEQIENNRQGALSYWNVWGRKQKKHAIALSKNMGEVVKCPSCGTVGGKAIMGRWHGLDGEKCRGRPNRQRTKHSQR